MSAEVPGPEHNEPSPARHLGLTESETRSGLSLLDLLFVGRWNQMTQPGMSYPSTNEILDITHKLLNADMAARDWKMPPSLRRPTIGRASLVVVRYLEDNEVTKEDATAMISSASVFVDRMNEIDATEHLLREIPTDFEPLTIDDVRYAARQLGNKNLAKVAGGEPTTEYLRIAGQHFSPVPPPEDSEH